MSDRVIAPGWHPIAIRSQATGNWDALPRAPWTVDEAHVLISTGQAEKRTPTKGGRVLLEVRAR